MGGGVGGGYKNYEKSFHWIIFGKYEFEKHEQATGLTGWQSHAKNLNVPRRNVPRVVIEILRTINWKSQNFPEVR